MRLVATIGISSLALASCSTTSSSSGPSVTGIPASSITVGLQVVGCTPSGTCITLGGPGSSGPVYATAEERTPKGHWSTYSAPLGSQLTFSQLGCSNSLCVVFGQSGPTQELWTDSLASNAFQSVPLPPKLESFNAVSCNADSCNVLYTSTTNQVFIGTVSSSAVPNWSTAAQIWPSPSAAAAPTTTTTTTQPATTASSTSSTTSSTSTSTTTTTSTTLPASNNSSNENVSGLALSCPDTYQCVAAVQAGTALSLVRVLPGIQSTESTNWKAVASLSCSTKSCEALITTPTGKVLAHSSNFAKSWRYASAPLGLSKFQCATTQHCVGIGPGPWVGWINGLNVTPGKTTYVPSALLDVACSTKDCAAIGITTVASVRLTP